MLVMLFMGATFVKENFYLTAIIVSFDTAGQRLLSFHILGPYPSEDIQLDLSHVISH